MNKKQHKGFKRAHTAARIRTQNQWIEDAFGVATDNRLERDRLFAMAREILGAPRYIRQRSA